MANVKTIIEPERKIPVGFKADVVVVGGGPAGIGAALAAARNGAKTILMEQLGYLGGAATNCLVSVFEGVDFAIYGGIFREVCKQLKREGKVLAYDIPYRCLVPMDTENLLAAGSITSTDISVWASSRNMACSMSTGQAAGTAAALAVKNKVTPRKLDVKLLQHTLRKQGAEISVRHVPKKTYGCESSVKVQSGKICLRKSKRR